MRRARAVGSVRAWQLGAAAVALAWAVPHGVSAHRLDEYLQAARIGVDRDRLEIDLDLTPGVAVADEVYDAIDIDRDGLVSASEADRYARRVLADLSVELDGRARPLTLTAREFPERAAMREGVGTIRLRARAASSSTGGTHEIVFRNRHRPDISVYLANALAPAQPSIAIAAQRRDFLQRELRIRYQDTASRPWRTGVSAGFALLITGLIVRHSVRRAS